MLSRVAEAIYWASRYVERAENVARVVDVNLNQMLETPVQSRSGWHSLVMTTGDHQLFAEHHGEATAEKVAWFLTFDQNYPNSIISSLSSARDNARSVREVISREMWQHINDFYLSVREASTRGFRVEELAAFYEEVKMRGIYYQGLTSATLSRGEAYQFGRLGRLLERADKTSRILDVKYYMLLPKPSEAGTTVDQVGWGALLSSVSALQMYRQRHQVTNPEDVAHFLLLNRQFPRSISYCVTEAQASLHSITRGPQLGYSGEAERLLGKLQAELVYARIQDITSRGLHEYIDWIQTALNEVGDALQAEFFSVGPLSVASQTSIQESTTSAL